MSRKVYLHVGYPKTATSALQKYIFPNVDGINYIGKNEGARDRYKLDTLEKVLLDASTMKHTTFASVLVKSNLLDSEEGQILISDEVLMFNLFRPTMWRDDSLTIRDVIDNLSLLESAIGVRFHIIITIRKQAEMIASIYAQCFNSCYSRMKETSSFGAFVDYFFNSTSLFELLDYEKVYSAFSESFDNVNLVVYESAKETDASYLSSFGRVLNVNMEGLTLKQDNVRQQDGYKKVDDYSLSDLIGKVRHKVKLLRHVRLPFIRRLLHKVKLRDMSSVSVSIVVNDEQARYIKEFYRKSNYNLSALVGLDLQGYGYLDE